LFLPGREEHVKGYIYHLEGERGLNKYMGDHAL
jgi:hypothetical protein